jgi:predicted lipid-binding transport protein (Tim44 family)
MRRPPVLSAALLATFLALAPGLALARAGDGLSLGSRGVYTYSAPPGTGTAPYAAPLQRSLTPQPGYGAQPSPGYGYGYGRGGSPFVSGLMGGLIGAGIGGLLFGHGLFWGIHGLGGLFGFALQILLLVWLFRWLTRAFFGGRVYAGGGGLGGMGMAPPRPVPLSTGPSVHPIQIGPGDYQTFEQMLVAVQAAWSNHDINALRGLATPEMVSYFAEQLGEQASRGVHNVVTNVLLQHGDLAQAWAEDGREYATVAMRFTMTDVTRDAAGTVVDGSLAERITATEIWTFLRVPGGRWVLSAIQQAR